MSAPDLVQMQGTVTHSSSATGSFSRRELLGSSIAAALGVACRTANRPDPRALIAISLDLEMSAQYPRREMIEWNYEKGNLDDATKEYAVAAARVAQERGGRIHFFCVGRVLEQANVDWLAEIAAAGHPIGNHTYDHVNVKALRPEDTQYRFQRAPWLIEGMSAREIIEQNIRVTNIAMKKRLGITSNGFRTPGGFSNGLADRPDLQQMLLELGFNWVSSKYPSHLTGNPRQEPTEAVYASIVQAQAQAQPFLYPTGLVEIPMSPISDVTAFRSNYWKLDYFLKAIRVAIEWVIASGGVFDFLAHPSCLVVEDPTFESIKLICDMARDAGSKATIVGLDTIARGVSKS